MGNTRRGAARRVGRTSVIRTGRPAESGHLAPLGQRRADVEDPDGGFRIRPGTAAGRICPERFDRDRYRDKHMPLGEARRGDGCKYCTVDKGLAAGAAGQPATCFGTCHIIRDPEFADRGVNGIAPSAPHDRERSASARTDSSRPPEGRRFSVFQADAKTSPLCSPTILMGSSDVAWARTAFCLSRATFAVASSG